MPNTETNYEKAIEFLDEYLKKPKRHMEKCKNRCKDKITMVPISSRFNLSK